MMSTKETLCFGAAIALAVITSATAYSQDEPQFPPRLDHVSDYAQILPDEVEGQLNRSLAQAAQELGVQIFILTVPTTEPLPLNTYSDRIADVWDLGREDSNRKTLLFLIAVDDGLVRLAPNKGLEAILTDESLRRVLETTIIPAFAMGEYTEGVVKGTQAILDILAGSEHGSTSEAPGGGAGSATRDILGVVLALALVVLVLAISGLRL